MPSTGDRYTLVTYAIENVGRLGQFELREFAQTKNVAPSPSSPAVFRPTFGAPFRQLKRSSTLSRIRRHAAGRFPPGHEPAGIIFHARTRPIILPRDTSPCPQLFTIDFIRRYVPYGVHGHRAFVRIRRATFAHINYYYAAATPTATLLFDYSQARRI